MYLGRRYFPDYRGGFIPLSQGKERQLADANGIWWYK